MADPTSDLYSSNRHADVLNEEPTDEAAKIQLCEEVKNRAKGAFVQKDMPSAELLYAKAIDLLATMPGKSEAALYSNRSLVRLKLNKVEGALEDAKKCLEIDPKFFKAYHRKAVALCRLGEWDDAIKAAEEGQLLEQDNKAFREVIEKAWADKAKELTDEAAKIQLCEEVKNRAKGAFVQKDMPSAELLYGKAIDLLATMPGKSEAALYSNRSLVRLKLNKVEGALEDAKKCLEIDPKFFKAYHRKAVALCRLGEWDDAIKAAEEGQLLEPDNKAFREVIEKAWADKAKDLYRKRIRTSSASMEPAPMLKDQSWQVLRWCKSLECHNLCQLIKSREKQGKPLKVLKCVAPFLCAAALPSIAVPDFCGIRVHDVVTGKQVDSIDIGVGMRCRCLASAPNCKYLAGLFDDEHLHVLDMACGQIIYHRYMPVHDWCDKLLSFGPCSRRLAVGAMQNVQVLDVATGILLMSIPWPLPPRLPDEGWWHTVVTVKYAPCGSSIAAGCSNGQVTTVQLTSALSWSLAPGYHELRSYIYEGDREVYDFPISYSPDGRNLAVGCHGEKVSLIDAQSCATISSVELAFDAHSIEYSCDGKQIAVLCRRGELCIFNDQCTNLIWKVSPSRISYGWFAAYTSGADEIVHVLACSGTKLHLSVYGAAEGNLLHEAEINVKNNGGRVRGIVMPAATACAQIEEGPLPVTQPVDFPDSDPAAYRDPEVLESHAAAKQEDHMMALRSVPMAPSVESPVVSEAVYLLPFGNSKKGGHESSEMFRNELLNGKHLKKYRDALQAAGEGCVLPDGALVFVHPEQMASVRKELVERSLRGYNIIVTESLEYLIDEVLTDLFEGKSRYRPRLKKDKREALNLPRRDAADEEGGFCDAQKEGSESCESESEKVFHLIEKRTFLCYAPELRSAQSVPQSTTEVVDPSSEFHYAYERGLNPRRVA